jgi:hypothetical protein
VGSVLLLDRSVRRRLLRWCFRYPLVRRLAHRGPWDDAGVAGTSGVGCRRFRDGVSLRRPGPGALPLSGYGTFFSR